MQVHSLPKGWEEAALSQLDLLLLEGLLATSMALFLQGRCVPGAGLKAERVLRVQHPWLLPKGMNKLLSEGQVAHRHFATDLFPCELMKRYTQFQKRKKNNNLL